ncbi:MAG: DUF6438 domain-containing protein [Saprospiraceae bacterium]
MKFKALIMFFGIGIILSCHRKGIKDNSNENTSKVVIPRLPVFLTKMSGSDTNVTNLPKLLVYKKTPCFGYCPVYEFTLYANGISCYNGLNFVKQEGKTYGLMKEKNWQNLLQIADQINFFNLDSIYPQEGNMQIPDLPLTIITLNTSGRTKTVTDSHSAPKGLKELESSIESEINTFLDEHLR